MANAAKRIRRRARANGVAVLALALLSLCVAERGWAVGRARIVFGGYTPDFQTSVYVTDPKGTFFEELTERGRLAADPEWSHDGRTIAFTHSPEGLARRIYLMDPDGGSLRRLTNAPAPYGDYLPTWSPRDDVIAFTSSREGATRQGIYLVDVGGGAETRLTPLDGWEKWPTWNPAERSIAYASASAGFLDIHVMDDQGRHLAQLTDRDRLDMTPSWHPRGEAIAFSSQSPDGRVGDGDIHTVEPDGANDRRLTKHPADDIDPSWSPDGTEILFTSGRDGPGGLFIMDSEGRRIRRVTEGIGGQFRGIQGSSWFDPDVPRSVSPIGRHATTWGWMKRLGTSAR